MFGHSCTDILRQLPLIGEDFLLLLFIFTREIRGTTCYVFKNLYQFYYLWKKRRIFLIQQYLNHLKNLAMVDHFIRRKTRKKPRSCCSFIRNQGRWETVRDTFDNNRFYETFYMSHTTLYYTLNKISDQIEKKVVTEASIPPICCSNLQTFSRWLYLHNRRNVWPS